MKHGPRLLEILLIETNQADIDLIIDTLAHARVGNRVHVVRDGEAALNFLRRNNAYRNAIVPDLVLLSVNVPSMAGREVLTEIKNDPALKRFPVFLLTGDQSSAEGVISKPSTPGRSQQIIQAIESYWYGNDIL